MNAATCLSETFQQLDDLSFYLDQEATREANREERVKGYRIKVEYQLVAKSEKQARRQAARQVQRRRFDGSGKITNSEMGPADVWTACALDDSAQALLQAAMKQMHLSARGFHRILKVSRTIADLSTTLKACLAGADTIGVAHPSVQLRAGMAEALQYRPTGWG